MRIAVLGASGRTGREVVGALLAKGHEVTALTRKPWSCEGVEVALPTGMLVVDMLRDREHRIAAREIPAPRPSRPVLA